MNRLTKQIVYGFFYLACLGGVVLSFYGLFFKPVLSCTDGFKNRDEEAVDCGGSYCVSCEVKNLSPISVWPVRLLPGSDKDSATAVSEMRNPNPRYGLTNFSYLLQVYATSTAPVYTEKVSLPMYPAELKYRVSVNIPVAYKSITRANLLALPSDGAWRAVSEFAKPNLPIREVKSVPTDKYLVVTGIVRNENVFPLRQVVANVFLEDSSGKLASASKTTINDLLVSQERGFQVVVPLPESYSREGMKEPRIILDGTR